MSLDFIFQMYASNVVIILFPLLQKSSKVSTIRVIFIDLNSLRNKSLGEMKVIIHLPYETWNVPIHNGFSL